MHVTVLPLGVGAGEGEGGTITLAFCISVLLESLQLTCITSVTKYIFAKGD